MKLKSMFFSAAIFAVCGLPLMAQDGPPPEGGPGPGGKGPRGPMSITAESLKTDLQLTEDQVAKLQLLLDKIKVVFEDLKKEMEAQRDSGTFDREAMKATMENTKKKILEILAPAKDFLSADQYKTLIDKFTKRPERKKGGPGGPDGPPPEDN